MIDQLRKAHIDRLREVRSVLKPGDIISITAGQLDALITEVDEQIDSRRQMVDSMHSWRRRYMDLMHRLEAMHDVSVLRTVFEDMSSAPVIKRIKLKALVERVEKRT
jgi:hypothetical protein